MSDAWNPDQYHRFRAERSQPFFDLLGLVERDGVALGGPRVVDLGCGTGELTAEAHRVLGARTTVGIDSSRAMLDDAMTSAGDRVTFVEGDLAAFPEPGGQPFDLVLSNAALQWVPDHERVLAQWASALGDGGQLAVQVPANVDHAAHVVAAEVAEEPQFADAFAATALGTPPPDTVHNVLLPERYAEVLDELGFARQHVRLQIYGHHLASSAEVVEWIKGTSLTRFQRVLMPEQYDAYLARYRERLLEVLGDRSPYFYGFKRILMWGRR